MSKKAQRKRKRTRELLEEMYVWQSLGTVDSPSAFALTESQVKQLWVPGGVAPWSEGASSGASAAEMYHGRLYLAAAADLARSMEEQVILRVERARLARWLQVARLQLQRALQRHVNQGRAGPAFLVQQHMAEVEAQVAEMGAWGPW